jgi:hypothetical protein
MCAATAVMSLSGPPWVTSRPAGIEGGGGQSGTVSGAGVKIMPGGRTPRYVDHVEESTNPDSLESPGQLGLLDLAVDLSVREVYTGTDFTLYLHIKNPFSRRVWVRSVELSLPTQLSWRDMEGGNHESALRRWTVWRADARIRRIAKLEARLADLDNPDTRRHRRLRRRVAALRAQAQADEEVLAASPGVASLSAGEDSQLNIGRMRAETMRIHAGPRSEINVGFLDSAPEPERVPLTSSLPKGAALEPGSTDVWTIRLGSGRSPFVLPAMYHLQLTVIYSLDAPAEEGSPAKTRLFSNTTSFTVPLKAALWSIMLGGAVGAAIGSLARSLQAATTIDRLFETQGAATTAALVLAIMLSVAAIVFAARKSDAQSFVTVEDFWGGVLVGFLIGYSGTAAFADLTGFSETAT